MGALREYPLPADIVYLEAIAAVGPATSAGTLFEPE